MSSSSEKVGGGQFNFHRASIFHENINACSLIYLGWNGTPFTWVGKRKRGVLVKERFDRALANDDWCLQFPESMVFHLPKILSDHHPLLIDLDGTAPRTNAKPFRFEEMWTHHTDFERLITESWDTLMPAHTNLDHFSGVLRQWNNTVFGNIFRTKWKLLARIEGIQNKVNYQDNPFIMQLEGRLLADYFCILH